MTGLHPSHPCFHLGLGYAQNWDETKMRRTWKHKLGYPGKDMGPEAWKAPSTRRWGTPQLGMDRHTPSFWMWAVINVIFYVLQQVNNAWSLNRTMNQWVDLGIHTEACLTRPDTCSAAGGAISLWVYVSDYDGHAAGIVSSHVVGSTGLVLDCKSDGSDNIRYDELLFSVPHECTQWIELLNVLVYWLLRCFNIQFEIHINLNILEMIVSWTTT